VGGVIINANQNHEEYRSFGVRVVSDAIGGFAGPLAGFHAGLSVSKRRFSPRCPAIRRSFRRIWSRACMRASMRPARSWRAKTGDQPHPVFSLMRRGVLDHLADFLKGGGRKMTRGTRA